MNITSYEEILSQSSQSINLPSVPLKSFCDIPMNLNLHFFASALEASFFGSIRKSIFAILNSTWGELCMEALGATLGGGALKLEATHLRQLPLPVLSDSAKRCLTGLARETLNVAYDMTNLRYYRLQIDQVVVSALAGRRMSVADTKATVEKLASLIHSLRAKRRRGQMRNVMEEE